MSAKIHHIGQKDWALGLAQRALGVTRMVTVGWGPNGGVVIAASDDSDAENVLLLEAAKEMIIQKRLCGSRDRDGLSA